MHTRWDVTSVNIHERAPSSGVLHGLQSQHWYNAPKKISIPTKQPLFLQPSTAACFSHTRSFTITTTLYLESAPDKRRRLKHKCTAHNSTQWHGTAVREWESSGTRVTLDQRRAGWCLSPYCGSLNYSVWAKTPTKGALGAPVLQTTPG